MANAVRGREAAHWAKWADCIRMGKQRHPPIAATLMRSSDHDPAPCSREVKSCQRSLMEAGFDIPEWERLTESPPTQQEGEIEPSQPKRGWQQRATQAVEDTFFWNQVWPNLSQADQALQRSKCGPLASTTWTALPVDSVCRIRSQSFRVLLCRRIRFPILLCSRICQCGRLLDIHGHQRAACAQAGVLGRRGFLLGCAAAQVCVQDPFAIVPGLVVSTHQIPDSFVFAHLPMWPPLGHPWPSSSSVCASRGSGSKRFAKSAEKQEGEC